MTFIKRKYTAIITLALFMMGLFNIMGIEPVAANDYGISMSFSGLEDKILSGEVNFSLNTKISAATSIKDEWQWQLRYKLELMRLPNYTAVVGKTVYYNTNSELDIVTAGNIFKPQNDFSLEVLKSTNGVTTSFKTNLEQGEYVILLSLIRVDNAGNEIELLAQNTKRLGVTDVMYVITGFEEEMPPGEMNFNINCQVGASVADTVYLRHKATILLNNLPLSGISIQYQDGTGWSDIITDSDGIVYFGPGAGFTLKQLPQLQGPPGVTTAVKTILGIGEYKIKLELVELGSGGETVIGSPAEVSFNVQRYPVLIEKFPDTKTTGLTNDKLFMQTIDGVVRYFIRLTYELDGDLRLSNNAFNLLRACMVHSSGGSAANIIDLDFLNIAETTEGYASRYIFVKEDTVVHLYIPIKPLRPQTGYQVKINENIIYYHGGNNLDGSGNKAESWSFGTMAVPVVSGISLGSVGEDYDVYEPIIITGNYFDDDVITVMFNNTYAYRVNVINNDGNPYLEVYLPRGRDRLSPGIYNITIMKNNDSSYSQVLYGNFSVVKASDLPLPQDGVRVKTDNRLGDVVQTVKTSSDTLLLKSTAADERYLHIDLDELMGEHVLARKIRLPGNRRSVGLLDTTSRWANIAVHNLKPGNLAVDTTDELEIRLGRVESTLIPVLKRGMIYSSAKSEFIEVGGDNITFDKVDIEMPYSNSDGQHIRVLCYDETYRQWFELPFTKDLLNSKVKFSSDRSGIFVVAE